MATTVSVDLREHAYLIRVGEGLLEGVGGACRQRGLGAACFLVSDTNVAPLYAGRVSAALRAEGFRCAAATVPAGEASKSLAQLEALYHRALEAGLDRSSFIVALGGGVVGDLAGFLAATLLRGLDLVQLPTTLLAMVDSSVGGKTGVNLPEGKNLVGAFHQPRGVWADLATLDTLPPREVAAGLAEVVKYGAILDGDFFGLLEERADEVLAREPGVLADLVARCCAHKAAVVAGDEREKGRRALLNFGHTLGHAIERCGGYGACLHGEAVAQGMVFAARLSVLLAGLPEREAERIETLAARFGLPTARPACAWEDLRAAMTRDKKALGGLPRFVLLDGLGQARAGCEVPEKTLRAVFDAWR